MHKVIMRSLFLAFLFCAASAVSIPAFSQVAVGVSVSFGPPAIPVYDQPPCPVDGYIWTPGYWAWDDDEDDYYWVPGTWVEPPQVGFFWTPGYWGWEDVGFIWHDGYWGPEVGFYGGVNYGFGYFGSGFAGGRWDHDRFYYNRSVTNVNVTVVHNVYEQRVTVVNENRVSYNGGRGGLSARASEQEQAAARQRHVEAVAAQQQQRQEARGNRELLASANHGKPPIAATDRPGAFSGHVVKAKDAGAPYTPPPANERRAVNGRSPNNAPMDNRTNNNANPAERRGNNQPNERVNPNENVNRGNPSNNGDTRTSNSGSSNRVVHPKDMPAYERPAAPNTGNPKVDQRYQQQQQKLADQQAKQQQKLEQQQEKEHQQFQKQQADQQRTQQMEERHQQQTEQMQQRQEQQRQQMQKRQSPPPSAHPAPAEHSGHSSEPKDNQKEH